MPEAGLDRFRHGRNIETAIEKFIDPIRDRERIRQDVVIRKRQERKTRLGAEQLFDLRQLVLIGPRENGIAGRGLPLPLQHYSLAS